MQLSVKERRIKDIVLPQKVCFNCYSTILADTFFLIRITILGYFHTGKTLGTCNDDNSEARNRTEKLFSFSLRGRTELSKYVYFCAQKLSINAGNKFQDLINVPRTI